jgi:hypothetical protein
MRTIALLALAGGLTPVPEEPDHGPTVEPEPAPTGGGEPDPTIGRVVHVRIGGPDGTPVLRAAVVVNAWPGSSAANLQVQLDPANDSHRELPPNLYVVVGGTIAAGSSITRGPGVGQWRWPARA